MKDSERKQMLDELRARVKDMRKRGVPKDHILRYLKAWERTDRSYTKDKEEKG